MRNHFATYLLLLPLSLAACGGASSPEQQDESGDSTAVSSEVDDEGKIRVAIEEQEWTAGPRIENRSLHFKQEKLLLILQADYPAKGEIPAGNSTFSIEKAGLETGAFSFVSRLRSADKDNPEVALIKVSVSQPFGELTSKEGTLNITHLKTRKDKNGSNITTQCIGTFEGLFRSENGTEHQVTGSFEYRAGTTSIE